MADFVSLTCPSCGSRLQVTNDLERFACGYCGNELTVRRGGGIVSLQPVLEGLGRVERTVSKMDRDLQHVGADMSAAASEFALQRIDREMAAVRARIRQTPPLNPRGPVVMIVLGVFGSVAATVNSGSPGTLPISLILMTIGLIWWWLSRRAAARVGAELGSQLRSLEGERAIHLQRVRRTN